MLTSLTPTKCKPLSSLTAREWMLTSLIENQITNTFSYQMRDVTLLMPIIFFITDIHRTSSV